MLQRTRVRRGSRICHLSYARATLPSRSNPAMHAIHRLVRFAFPVRFFSDKRSDMRLSGRLSRPHPARTRPDSPQVVPCAIVLSSSSASAGRSRSSGIELEVSLRRSTRLMPGAWPKSAVYIALELAKPRRLRSAQAGRRLGIGREVGDHHRPRGCSNKPADRRQRRTFASVLRQHRAATSAVALARYGAVHVAIATRHIALRTLSDAFLESFPRDCPQVSYCVGCSALKAACNG